MATMQESSPQEIRPGSPSQDPAKEQGIFALKRRFPGDMGQPPTEAAPAPSVGKKTNRRRLVLPLLLLVLVVGAIAYVTQNLPSWRSKTTPFKAGPGAKGEALVNF